MSESSWRFHRFSPVCLVRLLLQLTAQDIAAHCHVALDLTCTNQLYRELNQCGYQQNQAAHALNRITTISQSRGYERIRRPGGAYIVR